MYKKKLLFWLSFLYGLIHMYSTLVAVWLYQQGEMDYFITYISLFSFQKLLVIIFIINDVFKKKNIIFYIFDFFDLGFIYIFFVDSYDKSLQEFLNSKPIGFHLAMEFIFFFCLRIQDNEGIPSYVSLASYLNFFGFTMVLVFIRLKVEVEYIGVIYKFKKYIELFFRKFIIVQSTYLTLCSLTFFYDNNDMNLGYYWLILVGFNYTIMFIVYVLNRDLFRFCDLQDQFIMISFINLDFSLYNGIKSELEVVFAQTVNWFNQIVRVLVLLSYSYQSIEEYFQQDKQNTQFDHIRTWFVLCSLLFSLIYILLHSKDILFCLFRSKYFKIRNYKELENASFQLKNKNRYQNLYRIFLLKNLAQDETKNYVNQSLVQQQFLSAISQLIKQKQLIIIQKQLSQYLNISNIDILSKVEFVHKDIQRYLLAQLDRQGQIDDLIVQRLQNGFISNQFTQILLKRDNVKNEKEIMSIINKTLQINAYLKHVSMFMIINPQEILYSLYDV